MTRQHSEKGLAVPWKGLENTPYGGVGLPAPRLTHRFRTLDSTTPGTIVTTTGINTPDPTIVTTGTIVPITHNPDNQHDRTDHAQLIEPVVPPPAACGLW